MTVLQGALIKKELKQNRDENLENLVKEFINNYLSEHEQLTFLSNKLIKSKNNAYKSRFLVKNGNQLKFKCIDDVAYFYAEGKFTYLVSNDMKKYLIDYTLETLDKLLDSIYFFRVNRKLIAKISSISDIRIYSNGRLKINVQPAIEGEVIISREKVPVFKSWIDQ
ncbi:hypothetical protein BH23BAC1_BH23BAC1_15190 [soil metagenome]